MKHRSTLLSIAIAGGLWAVAMPASSADSTAALRTVRDPVPGQYIVVLKDSAATLDGERGRAARVSSVAVDIAVRHRARLVRSYRSVLRGFVVRADDRALARLLADPRVAYVEEDGISSISATQASATWGLDRIDQRNLPLSTTYTYDTTAAGVHAYVIDSGVLRTHSQFSGRMGNGHDTVTSGGNGNTTCHSHGTHVAGTIGGTTWGVAKGVTLHPVRVLGCDGRGANSAIIAGLDWVVANHVKPAVANISINNSGVVQSFDDAVARLVASGVTAVVSAGNHNSNACNRSPAGVLSAIVVGSTTKTDARRSDSNYGSCLDVFAPGDAIVSASASSTTASTTMSGTSMAAPHVAGVAALHLATNPSATPAQVGSAITGAATIGKVTSAGSGSPNRLLYAILGGTVTYSVSGSVTNDSGAALAGVVVSTGGVSATTGSTGAYTLNGLANGSYTLTPSLAGYAFSPASRSVTVSGANVSAQNFTASSTGGGIQTYINDTGLAINDRATVDSPITVSDRSGNGSATTPVSVTIRHTYIGDLTVALVTPTGRMFTLHSRSGASTDDIVRTYSLDLSTEALNGTWILRVTDHENLDTGRIERWSLQF